MTASPPAPPPPSLLLVFAHPDDESFGVGGAAALYAAAGVPVHLACATKGERGAKDSALIGQKLGAIREGELRRACAALGVRNISFLGYRDGDLDKADPHELAEKLAAVIRRVRPYAVVTFGPDGVTRHPDHVAVGRAATAAFHRVRRREGYRYPRRLYYVALPESRRRAFRSGDSLMYTPDDHITAAVDISRFLDIKLKAIACHKSQEDARSFLAHADEWKASGDLTQECFVRAWPRGKRKEASLLPPSSSST